MSGLPRRQQFSEVNVDSTSLSNLLTELAKLPALLRLIEAQNREIISLQGEMRNLRGSFADDDDGWLDAKRAARYLGVSGSSFDKYRYKTIPRIKGYNLDGKTLYKKADLDSFVRLYALKARGLA